MNILDIIAARRDARENDREDLALLAKGAADGSIPDYQLSAWLMAAYLNPLSEQETAWLTMEMAATGERIDRTGLGRPWIDKHSTGGVGDKTTLVLMPLLAACGLTIMKMSGRGLGITGGTVDKLASVPGFRLDLSSEEMKAQAKRIGLAITGQTASLAPADKTLYALRDATATVDSIPLIVSSILSKKIAGGAEIIALDVKCGSGAFMKTLPRAKELAGALTRTGELSGLKCSALITDMDQPLGRTVGNALEVIEAARVLRGEPGGRFGELCLRLAGHTLFIAGLSETAEAGFEMARRILSDGSAYRKAQQWFDAQGASVPLDDIEDRLPRARVHREIHHRGAPGWAKRIDAETIGRAVVALGGGRASKEDEIDPAVGIEVHVEVGGPIGPGQKLFTVHASSIPVAEQVGEGLLQAVELSPQPMAPPQIVLGAL